MTQPRKALRADVPLHLYALAQARADEVRKACLERCKGCPGPEADEGCLTRKAPGVVAGRADWPICPLGMLRARTWEELVELYVGVKAGLSAGNAEERPAFVQDAFVALFSAVRNEDERRAQEIRSGGGGGPNFSGRRSGTRGA